MRSATRTGRVLGWLGFIAVFLSVVPAVGGTVQVVAPNAQTNAEGNRNNAFPFGYRVVSPQVIRVQEVYRASEVGSGTITQIGFRQDQSGVAFGSTALFSATIILPSTSNGPGALSTTFADSIGATARSRLACPISVFATP